MSSSPDSVEKELLLEQIRVTEAAIAKKEAGELSRSFEKFVKEAWGVLKPGEPLQWNWHLTKICAHLQRVADGDIKRLLINVPPRGTKSTLCSVMFPAWMWTFKPSHQFLTGSHSINGPSRRDAIQTRRLILSDWYQQRWGGKFDLAKDQQEKTRYENNKGGARICFGFGSQFLGEGGDCIIIDDPHSFQGALSDVERENTITVYDDGITTRLNNPKTGSIIIIMQRLHEGDLSGHVLRTSPEGTWVHLCFPQEFEEDHPFPCDEDIRSQDGELLWEDRWDQGWVENLKERATIYSYSGQQQQRPSPGGGGIFPADKWREWPRSIPYPQIEYLLQVWDTAFEEHEEADWNVCTTWGVFFEEAKGAYGLFLLGLYRERVSFPTLRKDAQELYDRWDSSPSGPVDRVLIEPKATGKSLNQELRRAGVPAEEFKPERNMRGKELGKVPRAHVASLVLAQGMVFYPEGKFWAKEVIEECALFPRGEHDDMVDTASMAFLWLRRGRWVDLDDEDFGDDEDEGPVRARSFGYG